MRKTCSGVMKTKLVSDTRVRDGRRKMQDSCKSFSVQMRIGRLTAAISTVSSTVCILMTLMLTENINRDLLAAIGPLTLSL